MESQSKLYRLTTADFELPLHAGRDRVSKYPADDLPQLLWPDGTVCWAANLYLLSGYRRGKSRKNKGGTLSTWAKHLSPLIRYCYQNRVDFIDLTDSHFKVFVNNLLNERDSVRPEAKKRTEPQVAKICSTVLNFLDYLNQRMPDLNLIGPEGRIRAEQKVKQITTSKGVVKKYVWIHEHVPRDRKARRRQPISTNAVQRLYEANASLPAPAFVTRRRYIMLRLLEITGGRRIEVAQVKVEDVEAAMKTGELKVFTAKQRRNDSYRFVPVTQADLKDILSFVKHYRQRLIRQTIGSAADHGYLFIAVDSGRPLEIDTHGTELYILRKAAGIDDEEACMHAFRHRYITNVFRDLIRTHHCENESDLKRLLLSTETLKLKVIEWTGHASIEALDHYIHLAFEAEAGFQQTLDLLQAKKVVESLHVMLKDYETQLRQSRPSPALLGQLADVVATAGNELGKLLRPEHA